VAGVAGAGVNKSEDLVEALEHWGLPPVPRVRQHSRLGEDRQATVAAFDLVNEVGWYKAGSSCMPRRRRCGPRLLGGGWVSRWTSRGGRPGSSSRWVALAPDHPWKRRAVLEVAERSMAAAG
jgi:hypothetical protein